MTPADLLDALERRGLALAGDGRGGLRVCPAGLLTPADRAALRRHKAALLGLLARRDALDELAWRAPPEGAVGVREAVVLDDGHGWAVAFLPDDLAAIVKDLGRLRRGRPGPGAGVGGLGARAAGKVAGGADQAELFGGVGGVAGRATGGEGL